MASYKFMTMLVLVAMLAGGGHSSPTLCGLTDLGTDVAKTTDTCSDVDNVVDTLKESKEKLIVIVKKLVKKLVETIKQSLKDAEHAEYLKKAVIKIIVELIEKLKAIKDAVKKDLMDLLNPLFEFLNKLFGKIKKSCIDGAEQTSEKNEKAFKVFVEFLKKLQEALAKDKYDDATKKSCEDKMKECIECFEKAHEKMQKLY